MLDEVITLFDSLFAHDLEEACGIGRFNDDRTSAFNGISNAQLRMLLNEHGIQYPAYNEVAAKQVARYLIEREYYRRKKDIERVQRLTEKMETSMRFFGVKRFEEGQMTEDTPQPIQATDAAEKEAPTPITKEETVTTKKTKKAAAKKAAKTPKPVTPAKSPKPASNKAKKPARAKATRPAKPRTAKKVGKDTPKRSKGQPRAKATGKRAKGGASGRVRSPKMFTGKIKFLTKENPFRTKTKLYETYELMRKTGSVEEYRKQCERYPQKYTLQYLWLVKQRGFIKIEN